ncbi:MAG: hypothetical protein Harvfovirus2_18 [Harvfovirus sp.]|uniref:Uncharacterized protein n=1 Tax=Harvfovirus sp. TaxID=2487768 RepID=A0A3G4ZZY9_9VIRU|nr:MAG: hypothetical protein Harvfovirus2_18 [Harvfovirus sp.]
MTALHCGWKFLFDDEKIIMSLKEYIGDVALNKNVYVAVKYKQDCMQSWYDQRLNKISKGYVTSLFVKTGKKPVVVGIIMVDARRDYVIMANSTAMSPIDAKRQANTGLLGKEIKLSPDKKIPVDCVPYIVYEKT